MAQPQKRKGQPQPENEFQGIIRHFYWQLFIQLMIPAFILGAIFGIPVIILNNLPDRLNAQCTTYQESIGVRIISETQGSNYTSYYWTDDRGEIWHLLHTVTLAYQSAHADCDAVQFSGQETLIQTPTAQLYMSATGNLTIVPIKN